MIRTGYIYANVRTIPSSGALYHVEHARIARPGYPPSLFQYNRQTSSGIRLHIGALLKFIHPARLSSSPNHVTEIPQHVVLRFAYTGAFRKFQSHSGHSKVPKRTNNTWTGCARWAAETLSSVHNTYGLYFCLFRTLGRFFRSGSGPDPQVRWDQARLIGDLRFPGYPLPETNAARQSWSRG